jgi:putative aminopeptidase FrvX
MANNIINPDSVKFVLDYLQTPSPSGMEVAGQRKWMEYMTNYVDEFQVDAYGSVVGIINPKAPYKVVLEAHADEIGWNVSYISDDGFITVNRNGGSDHMCAPSKIVNIHTIEGEIVEGVFGYTAIHMRDRSDEKTPKVEDLFIDVGASSKEEVLAKGIDIGCKITYPDAPMMMGDDKLVGRALDNRIGGFMISQVARLLRENQDELDFGVYFANAVQEEVGLRGAEMLVESIKPNVAIVTDVCHDTSTPGIDKKKHGDTKIGAGPVIAYAPSIQNSLRESIIKVANMNEIDFQKLVSSSSSGTDTDAFAYGNGGTPTALIKIPLRYMHTTVETANIGDINDAIVLMYETLKRMKPTDNYSYFG